MMNFETVTPTPAKIGRPPRRRKERKLVCLKVTAFERQSLRTAAMQRHMKLNEYVSAAIMAMLELVNQSRQGATAH